MRTAGGARAATARKTPRQPRRPRRVASTSTSSREKRGGGRPPRCRRRPSRRSPPSARASSELAVTTPRPPAACSRWRRRCCRRRRAGSRASRWTATAPSSPTTTTGRTRRPARCAATLPHATRAPVLTPHCRSQPAWDYRIKAFPWRLFEIVTIRFQPATIMVQDVWAATMLNNVIEGHGEDTWRVVTVELAHKSQDDFTFAISGTQGPPKRTALSCANDQAPPNTCALEPAFSVLNNYNGIISPRVFVQSWQIGAEIDLAFDARLSVGEAWGAEVIDDDVPPEPGQPRGKGQTVRFRLLPIARQAAASASRRSASRRRRPSTRYRRSRARSSTRCRRRRRRRRRRRARRRRSAPSSTVATASSAGGCALYEAAVGHRDAVAPRPHRRHVGGRHSDHARLQGRRGRAARAPFADRGGAAEGGALAGRDHGALGDVPHAPRRRQLDEHADPRDRVRPDHRPRARLVLLRAAAAAAARPAAVALAEAAAAPVPAPPAAAAVFDPRRPRDRRQRGARPPRAAAVGAGQAQHRLVDGPRLARRRRFRRPRRLRPTDLGGRQEATGLLEDGSGDRRGRRDARPAPTSCRADLPAATWRS